MFRNIFLAELIDGKWTPQKSVAIRFYEYEASVPGILSKVQDALGSEDILILTDSQGNEILDTDGTKGACILSLCSDFEPLMLMENISYIHNLT